MSRGFTSQIIIDHVKDRDGEIIDNVGEALDRAVAQRRQESGRFSPPI
ncbi:MAG: hypothetical protein ACLUNZ_02560 [Evtepia sp.]